MTRTADQCAVSADDDAAGITEEAAIEWLRREYGLSLGAATLELQNAWNSGKVDGWDNLAEMRDGKMVLRDGKPVHIPPRLSQITGGLVHDHRLHADDLRWQIEQQLGKPPAGKVPKPKRTNKPPQADVDKALHKLAKARDQKVKQGDAEARAILHGLGATTRQIAVAFRNLPGQYSYGRGKPGKSGN